MNFKILTAGHKGKYKDEMSLRGKLKHHCSIQQKAHHDKTMCINDRNNVNRLFMCTLNKQITNSYGMKYHSFMHEEEDMFPLAV